MTLPATPASPSPRLQQLLAQYGVRARKSLGQHFLVNQGVLEKIVAAAEILPTDTVLEIGAGLGTLTRELAARAQRLIAVEKDERLAEAVRAELAGYANLTVIAGDLLELDPAALLAQQGASPHITSTLPSYTVVANLPYNVGTAIVRHLLESSAPPVRVVALLQREVAQNMCAPEGEMGLLGVATRLYAEPSILGIVRPGSFSPAPKVDSAIVRLEVRAVPAVVSRAEAPALLDLARAGFSARRKQLGNALAQGLGIAKEQAGAMLHEAGVAQERRAETLTLEEWGRLYRAWKPARAGVAT
ncbi:MAG: ribosomal RNA small subunit methyltransferase A [Dehalococcoidia bacterium]|nr:ribosomal RNA small subunit methyltransferase A [Dehalococcoidia bacterium]